MKWFLWFIWLVPQNLLENLMVIVIKKLNNKTEISLINMQNNTNNFITRKKNCFTWLHWSETEPTGSQSHGSHPVPLAIFQWFDSHWSHSFPTTFGKHGHCPVILSQGPALPSVPSISQTHSVKKKVRI